jgi:hypothetical protein
LCLVALCFAGVIDGVPARDVTASRAHLIAHFVACVIEPLNGVIDIAPHLRLPNK